MIPSFLYVNSANKTSVDAFKLVQPGNAQHIQTADLAYQAKISNVTISTVFFEMLFFPPGIDFAL